MKTKILLLTLCGLMMTCCYLNAQVMRSYAMGEPNFVILFKDVSNYKVLDRSYLNLIYKTSSKSLPYDSTQVVEDQMALYVGKKYTKFFNITINQTDSLCTELSKTQLELPMNESIQGYEVFRNNSTKKIEVTN